jgi:hypothetical protein
MLAEQNTTITNPILGATAPMIGIKKPPLASTAAALKTNPNAKMNNLIKSQNTPFYEVIHFQG